MADASDVLEQGEDALRSWPVSRRLPPRLLVIVGGIALAAAALVPALTSDEPVPPTGAAAPATGAAGSDGPGWGGSSVTAGSDPGAAGGASMTDLAALPPAARGDIPAGDVVLLATVGAPTRLDLGTGVADTLDSSLGEWVPTSGRLVAGAALDAVVSSYSEGAATGYDAVVHGHPRDGGPGRLLGWAPRVVPAVGGGFWFDRGDASGRPVVSRIDELGRRVGEPRRLPPGTGLLADTPAGLIVGPRFGPREGGGLGPIDVVEPSTGRTLARLSARGRLLDSHEDVVLWSECAACPPQVARLAAADHRPQPLDLEGRSSVAAGQLSPDGQHVAVAVPSAQPGRWDVLVAHLPGTTRDGQSAPVLAGLLAPAEAELPLLAWTRSGRLVVSDGAQLAVVGPGPHSVHRVPLDVPAHTALGS